MFVGILEGNRRVGSVYLVGRQNGLYTVVAHPIGLAEAVMIESLVVTSDCRVIDEERSETSFDSAFGSQ